MFIHWHVYDNWVKLDANGEMCSIQDKSENCIEDFSWKSRKKETFWKMYGVHKRFMLSGSYRNEELKIGNELNWHRLWSNSTLMTIIIS